MTKNRTNSFAQTLNQGCQVFVQGLFDSLSIHKTLTFLVNSKEIATDVLQCCLANGVLLLGSLFLFHRFIVPFTRYLKKEVVHDLPSSVSSIADISVWSFYHILWILPIWVICYLCSLNWYQSIALNSYNLHHGINKKGNAPDVQQTVSNTVYATSVWGFAYCQVLIFDKLMPLLLSNIIVMIKFVLVSLDLSSIPATLFKGAIEVSILPPLYILLRSSQLTGGVLMSIMYGWYGFDMIWGVSNISLSSRYANVESRWLYFLGFGLPYTLMIKFTSFFLGYGLYLLIFPFAIMISTASNWEDSSSQSAETGGVSGEWGGGLPPLRVFRIPRALTEWVVRGTVSRYLPKRRQHRDKDKQR
jgi:hypothetical protein